MQRQPKKFSAPRGRYLYAIVAGTEPKSYLGLGINGGRVYTISVGDVSAVVSDVPNERIRPERRHLAAHQLVLKTVMENGGLLPMSFGIISSGRKSVEELLTRNNDAISSQLRRVAGKVEMGLKVTWDVPNIFEYMVNIHPELLEARDELLNRQHPPTQDEKIEIGQLFEQLLNADRERHSLQVERVLRPKCFEIKRNKSREEQVVMNLACLVDRKSLAGFEQGVLESAAFFDDNFAFDYNGPWAPHNFVEIEVDI